MYGHRISEQILKGKYQITPKAVIRDMETALEEILTNSYKDGMIAYVTEHPDCFTELIQLSVADKQPYSWRAAWLLWSCLEKNDPRVRKYVRELIAFLPAIKDNQQRELLKILHQMEIQEAFEGILFDHCVTIWEKISKQPSVRCNAFKMLVKIAKKHPEFSSEIVLLTQHQYTDSLSPAVKKAINKMINDLGTISRNP